MIKNFEELVTQIKTQVPIQELISEFVTVKKSGRGYVALCPFHDDHHPSLQIHPQKGIFKCFSCGTGGDVITFYALINKKKWSEALQELALKYGIKIEYGVQSKTEIQIKNQLYELNRVVTDFFKQNLFSKEGKEALDYLLKTRKLKPETIEKYEIGFAQNSWDSLYNYLTKQKGFMQELIIASGLFVITENERYYDRFRNRIIFPILNETGNLTGFGGRTLSKEDTAKYLNSPETLIFNKGHGLYGLNFAKDEITKEDEAILTEGYFDVITAHQNGLLNTVATLGTALTQTQIRLLTKYTESKRAYVCLDSDTAGKKAVENVFRLVQDINIISKVDLRVVTSLEKKDLDEEFNISDLQTIKNKIKTSEKLIFFILNKLSTDYLSSENDIHKNEIMDQITDITIRTTDPVKQNENINYICHKLNLEEELVKLKIKEKVKRLKAKARKTTIEHENTSEDNLKMYSNERFRHAEAELLTLYISSFPYASEIRNQLAGIEFLDDKNKLIKEHLDNITDINILPEVIINRLIFEFNEYKHLMDVITDLALRIESSEPSSSKHKEKILSEAKEWIKWWVTNKQKLKSLTTLLKETNDKDEETKILTQMMSLVKNNS